MPARPPGDDLRTGASASPTVSVVVPAYNRARYVDQALASLVAQTFGDWEAVVVDDGSTDDTLACCRAWAARDGRIRVLTQPNSGGPAAPRNRAVAETHGRYIAFLDPDDWWFADKLRQQCAILERELAVGLLFDDSELVDAAGASLGSYFGSLDFLRKTADHVTRRGDGLIVAEPSFLFFASCVYTGIQTSGVVVRRSALDSPDTPFSADVEPCEDVDLWWRLMMRTTVAFVPHALHAYRQHAESLTHQAERPLRARLEAHRRNYERVHHLLPPEWCRRYRDRIGDHYRFVGWRRRLAGDDRGARACYRAAWRWRPGADLVVATLKSLVPRALSARLRDPAA